MKIYPSILETSVDGFFNQLNNLLPYFDHFQIDITDGIFVPNKTVQIEEITEQVTSYKLQDTNKTFEFHLMVMDYEKEIDKLNHMVKFVNIASVLIQLKSLPKHYTLNAKRFSLGLVLNPEDSVTENWETIKQFEAVQLMTVHPGQQGSPFVPEALDKIRELREYDFTGKIILDGAMNDKTLPIVLQQKYLPDAICPGSYFKTDVEERLARLNTILHN